jgi:hypothetical protein
VGALLRPARPSDIPDLITLALEFWDQGRLSGFAVNEDRLRCLIVMALRHQGGGSFLHVAVEGGAIVGFLLGALSPLYLVTDVLEASEIAWIVKPGSHPLAGARLLKAFHAWAWDNPLVVRITQSASDTMGQISPAAVRLLERQGFRITGAIYQKERTP